MLPKSAYRDPTVRDRMRRYRARLAFERIARRALERGLHPVTLKAIIDDLAAKMP